jgi:hypothetical protein
LGGVEDMANQLLRVREAHPISQPTLGTQLRQKLAKLRTRYTRRYNHQKAKCDNPKAIGEWFALVQNAADPVTNGIKALSQMS